MRSKILVLLAALFMVLGITAVAAPGSSAHTGTSAKPVADTQLAKYPQGLGRGQWAYKTSPWGLINAWDFGPWIRNYYGGSPTSTNDDFTDIILAPSTNHAMHFSSPFYSGNGCIGDAFNDPQDARASLDSCGANGIGEGWGVDMTVGSSGCPSGWFWIHNVHWNGYLGPASDSNGANFYLNKPNKYCYDLLGPA